MTPRRDIMTSANLCSKRGFLFYRNTELTSYVLGKQARLSAVCGFRALQRFAPKIAGLFCYTEVNYVKSYA